MTFRALALLRSTLKDCGEISVLKTVGNLDRSDPLFFTSSKSQKRLPNKRPDSPM